MAEFSYNAMQTIAPSNSAILNTTVPCNRGCIFHRNDSSTITLRGTSNNPYARFARFQVEYSANIALSTGATVGPIAVALSLNGEELPTSRAIVTPAAVGDYFSVSSVATIDVPIGCCTSLSLENVSVSATPTTTPAPSIDMQNANVTVNRIA